ncbi:hypothetical protein TTRE_0000961801 [Trichuris trichiura]|uniref:Uncharacterized protein n=1 Tax=Trichuris trichiura TaxID=36087 RepID=A0A077ZLG2_TRITR|nr:hypothetical protein TTRE_0000961801 [Trichuris trichiura]
MAEVRRSAVQTNQFDYPCDVEEYGMHWNFFYTLALEKLIGEFSASWLHVPYAKSIVGVAITLALQVFLQGDEVQEYLFEEPRYRENGLFSLNREGIVSVFGCLTIFLFATEIERLWHCCQFVMSLIQNGHKLTNVLDVTDGMLYMLTEDFNYLCNASLWQAINASELTYSLLRNAHLGRYCSHEVSPVSSTL